MLIQQENRGNKTSQMHKERQALEQLIGNTPLFELKRLRSRKGPRLLLKLEQSNPGGSIKDRTALGMLRKAELDGILKPGMRIIESSSGNTAIGLAMLSRASGYSVTAVCDRQLPSAKRTRLSAYGADIIFLPATSEGLDTVELRIAIAEYFASLIPNSLVLGQYSNTANVGIHYQSTGPEIWSSVGSQLSAVVASVGTCGTISGVGRFLKERKPSIIIVGVEPDGSVIFGGDNRRYLIQGGGLSFVPPILDRAVIDHGVKVTDAQAIKAIHQLARLEGCLVGGTGGLVVHTMLEIACQFPPESTILGIIPDGGERYLDTLYDSNWLRRQGLVFSTEDKHENKNVRESVQMVGCSLNDIPENDGPSIEQLCERMGIPVPGALAST